MQYDKLGRLVTRTEFEGASTWQYDLAPGIGDWGDWWGDWGQAANLDTIGFTIAQDCEGRARGGALGPERQQSKNARGMGLGLPIVKRTVFDHNGRVDIDSNPHGTSVSVMLPASANGD